MLSYLKWVLLIVSIYVQGYYSVKFIQNDPFLMISLIILISISVFMLLALYLIKEEEKILLNDESISKQFISDINREFSYNNNISVYNIKFDYEPRNVEAIKFIIGSFFIAGLLGSFFGIGETLGDSISSLSSMKNIDIVKLISPLGNLKTVIGVSISGLLTALTIETFLQDLYLDISNFEAKISKAAKNVALLKFNTVKKEEKIKFDSLLEIVGNINTNMKTIETITEKFKLYGDYLIDKLEKTSDSTLSNLAKNTNFIYKSIQENNEQILQDVKNNNKHNLYVNNELFKLHIDKLSKNEDFINNIIENSKISFDSVIEKVAKTELKNLNQLEIINKKSENLFTETKNNFIKMFNFMDDIQKKQYDNIDKLYKEHSNKIDKLYEKQNLETEKSFSIIGENLGEFSKEIIKVQNVISSNKYISVDISNFLSSSSQLISSFNSNIENYKNNLEKITKNISQSINKTDDTLKTIENVSLVMKNNLKDFQLLEHSYKNMFNSDGLN